MALTETDVKIVRKFQDGSTIAYGIVDKEAATAQLTNPDGTSFALTATDETQNNIRAGIVAAYQVWQAAQLP